VATNGDNLDVVERDWWLEMERRQIDALGPKFEAVVDKRCTLSWGVLPQSAKMCD
jgi:hypothetical protein